MSTKKRKAPKTRRGVRAAAVIDRWAAMELELAETKKKLAHANELLAVADALMKMNQESRRERVGALDELKEMLAARDKDLFETHAKLDQAWRVNDAEVAFWKKEVEHLQQRLADATVAAAVKR